MGEFGWAYIDCEDVDAVAAGPTGSIQFHHAGSELTGSAKLVFNKRPLKIHKYRY